MSDPDNATVNPNYARLPESIKAVYSEREWMCLPQVYKNRLVQVETEPETD